MNSPGYSALINARKITYSHQENDQLYNRKQYGLGAGPFTRWHLSLIFYLSCKSKRNIFLLTDKNIKHAIILKPLFSESNLEDIIIFMIFFEWQILYPVVGTELKMMLNFPLNFNYLSKFERFTVNECFYLVIKSLHSETLLLFATTWPNDYGLKVCV